MEIYFEEEEKRVNFFVTKICELPNFFLKIMINQKLLLNSLLFRALRRAKRELKKKKIEKLRFFTLRNLKKLF